MEATCGEGMMMKSLVQLGTGDEIKKRKRAERLRLILNEP